MNERRINYLSETYTRQERMCRRRNERELEKCDVGKAHYASHCIARRGPTINLRAPHYEGEGGG